MNQTPDWLPPLTSLEYFEGDPIKYIEHLFSLFTRDFITSKPSFKGKYVFYDKADDNGKPRAFSHITTEENRETKERELCLRRCERIAWIRAIIEHYEDPVVLVWEKEQRTSKKIATRTYLFLKEEDFLVILQEIKHGHYMITAIYVDNPNQKRKHLKAYEKSKKPNLLNT
jgi:hypothetical protein